MPNAFTRDVLLQVEDIEAAARFYQDQAGLAVTNRSEDLISLEGPQLNLFLHRGAPPIGPVLELMVDDVKATRDRLVQEGGRILRDDHTDAPRCYVQDRYGLIYNLGARSTGL